jgi:thiamine-phosphate pyrophosphorylase
MLSEMTPATERALEDARQQAQLERAAEVQPWHLLAGLLKEEEGGAALRAAAAGLDRAAFWKAFQSRSPQAHEIIALVPPPLATTIQEALREARSLTQDLMEDCVSSELLLLALLRVCPDVTRELSGLGLEIGRLERALLGEKPALPSLENPLTSLDLTERMDTGRILDASANRAREALRVIEDYCRVVLEDAFLSGQVKELRHELAQALAEVPPEELLQARETLRDVGTAISTEDEHVRSSLVEVTRVNLKRLQEALRSLEEFGKLRAPLLGQTLERIRYRSYTLERAVLLGASARQRLREVRLQVLVSGAGCTAALDWTITEAAGGGAGLFQLREKILPDRELLERAVALRRVTRQLGVLFIINDRPDIARLVEADGVHVGQDDLPVKEARRIVGPDALVGVSTHNLDQVRQAILDGASYVGVGPVFSSRTKEFSNLVGPELVKQAVAETSLPIFAIGGINQANIGAVATAGGRRAAISQAVCQADDPRKAARELVEALKE